MTDVSMPNRMPARIAGPHLELWDRKGNILHKDHPALLNAISAIREGMVVAVKGIGGFQLIADARNDETVKKLRRRKRRMEKTICPYVPVIGSSLCPLYGIQSRSSTSKITGFSNRYS